MKSCSGPFCSIKWTDLTDFPINRYIRQSRLIEESHAQIDSCVADPKMLGTVGILLLGGALALCNKLNLTKQV